MLGSRLPFSVRALGLAAGLAAVALTGGRASASIEEIDYATYDVRITDSKGVVTEATDFGYYTGPNILYAHRGDGDVDVPYRLIRSMEIGAFVPDTRRAPCTLTLKTGKVIALELDNIEAQRLLGGRTEFGDYRIRMEKVRRLEILHMTHSGPS